MFVPEFLKYFVAKNSDHCLSLHWVLVTLKIIHHHTNIVKIQKFEILWELYDRPWNEQMIFQNSASAINPC